MHRNNKKSSKNKHTHSGEMSRRQQAQATRLPTRKTMEKPCFSRTMPMMGLKTRMGRLPRMEVCHDTSAAVPLRASRTVGKLPPRKPTMRLDTHHHASIHQNLRLVVVVGGLAVWRFGGLAVVFCS